MSEVTETTTVKVNDGNGGMSRSQFVQEEKAKQLDKGIEYLAQKNAELQYDLNRARAALPEGYVAVPKEDTIALAGYREQFATPKEAKDAKGTLGQLREKDELRSYDERVAAEFAKFEGEPPAYIRAMFPSAEEVIKQPGGRERLTNVDFVAEEINRTMTAYGAAQQDKTKETDVGVSPGEVKGGGDSGKTNEAKEAVSGFYAKQFPQFTDKEA